MKTMFVLTEKENKLSQFTKDVIAGLSGKPKSLPSKYFYDARGDELFRHIMACKDYYLTRCEMEIFTQQTMQIAQAINKAGDEFDLIEFGPGDCSKSKYVLRELLRIGARFNYIPIDISHDVICDIELHLPKDLPGIKISCLNGDYHQMLKMHTAKSGVRKVILNLGGNIGNMLPKECSSFMGDLRKNLSQGDIILTGFDLVKNPRVIQKAYDDSEGITRRFNLNLLLRISNELEADLEISKFDHYCNYDPTTGACKSYLIALTDTSIKIGTETFDLLKYESIWMEISQKYTVEQIKDFAWANGFRQLRVFTDSKEWFADALWEVR
ncbi:MAG TPA: L-histidine N(alpha)-methyltransferase [Mucilaginibacter sp.]